MAGNVSIEFFLILLVLASPISSTPEKASVTGEIMLDGWMKTDPPSINNSDISVEMTTSPWNGLEEELKLSHENSVHEPWGGWSPCSPSCEQIRKRICVPGNDCGDDEQKEFRRCYRGTRRCRRLGRVNGIPVERRNEALDRLTRTQLDKVVYDLLYYDWSEWSTCTRSCKRRRYRTCALKRWCKNTLLLAEQKCYVPGTQCEEKYLQALDKEEDPGSEKPRKDENDKTIRPSPSSSPADPYNPDKCGEREEVPSMRIVGGRESRRGNWPWQVAILTRFREQYCGGVLIAPQYVLTAAHCMRKRGRRRHVYVRVGEHDLSKDEGPESDLRPVLRYVHPDFDVDTIDSDVAVIKLEKPVPVSRFTKYACVPEANDTLPDNTICYAIGWGKMKETHLFGTDVLREAAVPIVSQQKCQSAFDYQITENQMCAGYKRGGTDTCAGDSGGPLMCQIEKHGVKRWHVYGVTSFGEGCGDRGKFGIYTRVTNFSEWIIKATHDS